MTDTLDFDGFKLVFRIFPGESAQATLACRHGRDGQTEKEDGVYVVGEIWLEAETASYPVISKQASANLAQELRQLQQHVAALTSDTAVERHIRPGRMNRWFLDFYNDYVDFGKSSKETNDLYARLRRYRFLDNRLALADDNNDIYIYPYHDSNVIEITKQKKDGGYLDHWAFFDGTALSRRIDALQSHFAAEIQRRL